MSIDMAEALLAVLGMRPIISHEIEDITEQQWRRVMSIETDIDRAARDLVHGTPKPVDDAEGIDYMPTLVDLSTPYQAHQVEEMLSKLPPWFADSAGAFLVVAHRAFQYLGSQLPRQIKTDLTGPKPIKPPQRLVDRFLSLLEVLDDHRRVFQLAANAQLLTPQIQAFDLVLPSVADYSRKALALAIRDAQAEDKGFRLHYHAEMGAEKFLGADLTSATLKKILTTPPPAPPPQKEPSAGGKPPTEQMTRVQRTDNLEVG